MWVGVCLSSLSSTNYGDLSLNVQYLGEVVVFFFFRGGGVFSLFWGMDVDSFLWWW
jgi:hypothetical protein